MIGETTKEQEKYTQVFFIEDNNSRIRVLFQEIAEHDMKERHYIMTPVATDLDHFLTFKDRMNSTLIVIDMHMEKSKLDAVVKYLAENKIKIPVAFINASVVEREKIEIEGMNSLNYVLYYEPPMHCNGLMKLIAEIKKDKEYPFSFKPDFREPCDLNDLRD